MSLHGLRLGWSLHCVVVASRLLSSVVDMHLIRADRPKVVVLHHVYLVVPLREGLMSELVALRIEVLVEVAFKLLHFSSVLSLPRICSLARVKLRLVLVNNLVELLSQIHQMIIVWRRLLCADSEKWSKGECTSLPLVHGIVAALSPHLPTLPILGRLELLKHAESTLCVLLLRVYFLHLALWSLQAHKRVGAPHLVVAVRLYRV